MSPAKKTGRASGIARLVEAMDRCAVARGEAHWTNGYRAAKPLAEAELWAREIEQWKAVDRADAAFRRIALSVLRNARAQRKP
jgi:hypothetical protein